MENDRFWRNLLIPTSKMNGGLPPNCDGDLNRKSFTEADCQFVDARGVAVLDELRSDVDQEELLADIGTWDGGIRQFLVDEQCDREMITDATFASAEELLQIWRLD
jgi:hypothetical protein